MSLRKRRHDTISARKRKDHQDLENTAGTSLSLCCYERGVAAWEEKGGVEQLIHFCLCISVYKCEFMIEEQLNFNQMFYFEHESGHESVNAPVAWQH